MRPRDLALALALLCLALTPTWSGAGVVEHLRALSSQPDRALGTPGEKATAAHVLRKPARGPRS